MRRGDEALSCGSKEAREAQVMLLLSHGVEIHHRRRRHLPGEKVVSRHGGHAAPMWRCGAKEGLGWGYFLCSAD